METLGYIQRRLNYFVRGKSRYYIHSPFIYEFVQKVLNDKRHFYAYSKAEGIRKRMLELKNNIEVEDLGAGSRVAKSNQRKVSEIVKSASISPKAGQLLFRMAQYYKPKTMLELGTSVGIGSIYLANGMLDGKLHTIEGSPNVANLAATNFKHLKETNISQLVGNFDDLLPTLLPKLGKIDMAFIDGNHRKKPTLDYFEQIKKHVTASSILVFDDIHWSNEMYDAWKTIQRDPDVSISLDLFRLGIVFFRKDIAKQSMALYF